MAATRLPYDVSFSASGSNARPRPPGTPLHLLLVADLGGARDRPLTERRPVVIDSDRFDAVFQRLAPRLTLPFEGQPLSLSFTGIDDFHPDQLLARLPAQRSRQASAAPQPQAPTNLSHATSPDIAPPPATDAAADIERLLGRPPQAAAPAAAAATGTAAALDRWLHDLVRPHLPPATGDAAAAQAAHTDADVHARLRDLLHQPALQALEAAWRSLDRLVRGLDLGEAVQLQVLDIGVGEWQDELSRHQADLSASALHGWLQPEPGPEGRRWGAIVVDHSFEPDTLPALAAWGALAARAGAPLLAGAAPGLALTEGEARQAWDSLRTAPMAPWIGLALPRVLLRLPYGAAHDPALDGRFEELPPGPPDTQTLLWGGAAPALALLRGQAWLATEGLPAQAAAGLLDDLPAFSYRDADGETQLHPVTELALGEAAGQAVLAQGLMPLLAWRQRPAAQLLRWQSIAQPAQGLRGLDGDQKPGS